MTGLVYVGDPMCSWCWGFAPQVEDLAEDWPVEVVVGGLRPGPMAEPLGDRLASFLAKEWARIAERTGQPFDPTFLETHRDRWVYDTEPAAVAVAEFRERHPDQTLDYFTAVQRAFYAEGRDVTDTEVLADLASGFGIDGDTFRLALAGQEARKRAWADFTRARNWGIGGFPALISALDDGRLTLLANGWTEAAEIRRRIASIEENP